MCETGLTFHNGVNVIGGTIVEVSYGKSRVFVDFSYEPDGVFTRLPDLRDLILKGAFPALGDLLDPSLGLPESGENVWEHTAVFLTHAHLDHSQLINYLRETVPLYCTPGTKKMLEALNVEGHFLLKNPTLSGTTRELTAVAPETPVEVGEINVEFISVDHDVIGASGLRIVTPTSVICHSGDIRLHGYRKEESLHFIRRCRGCDLLITEGVSVSSFEPGDPEEQKQFLTEAGLTRSVRAVLEKYTKRNLSFNDYIANQERMADWIGQLSDLRQIVLEEHNAYVLNETLGVRSFWYSIEEPRLGLDPELRVDFNALLEDDSHFFWQLETAALRYMDRMVPGGLYIHADAAPLGEWSPDWQSFFDRFAEAGVETMVLSSSGHASTGDLQGMIDAIGPKLFCPVHSFHPERLTNLSGERLLPEKGQTIFVKRKGELT